MDLRERLTRAQLISVLLASGAVAYLTFGFGRLPWVVLTLCSSFGVYGLLRKVSGAASIPGLFLETTIIGPLALGCLFYLARTHGLHFGLTSSAVSLLLISTGIVTGVPLLWFAHAARHLRLTTLGFLQYLSPSYTFFLGIFAFHEPFRQAQLLTFALIWIALAIFTADAVTRWRSMKASAQSLRPPRCMQRSSGSRAPLSIWGTRGFGWVLKIFLHAKEPIEGRVRPKVGLDRFQRMISCGMKEVADLKR